MKTILAAAGLLAIGATAASAQFAPPPWARGNFPYEQRHHRECQDKAYRLHSYERQARRLLEAPDLLGLSITAMTGMIRTLAFKTDRMRALAESGYATATDLADWLVREAGVPFREAHHITGRAVKLAEEAGCGLGDLVLDELRAIDPRINGGIYSVLSVEASVASRTSYGGTAPSAVKDRIAEARKALEG